MVASELLEMLLCNLDLINTKIICPLHLKICLRNIGITSVMRHIKVKLDSTGPEYRPEL